MYLYRLSQAASLAPAMSKAMINRDKHYTDNKREENTKVSVRQMFDKLMLCRVYTYMHLAPKQGSSKKGPEAEGKEASAAAGGNQHTQLRPPLL